ncbi:secreted RxLR effector protein 161-like [Apium graveolens]|uniref:secreted RxLR effector protein 161-like n=1 Tax=Apium graveolens TaxID=4045 RepID=UPI003D7A89AE
MWNCNATKLPMDPMENISKDEGGRCVDTTHFKSMIGGLRYLVHTRPDIAYSVGIVSRYMEKPTEMHLLAVKRILCYVRGTLNHGLVYNRGSGSELLIGYSDSDLAGHVEDRRSTGGMVFYLDDGLVTWASQKQRSVALSSCEAEFMAATAAACQAIWLRKMVSQVTGKHVEPVVLYLDNKSAIDLTKNSVFHGRSKHIDIRYHFIRECVENGDILVKHVSTDLQRADVLTKALPTARFEKMRLLLGVRDLQTVV